MWIRVERGYAMNATSATLPGKYKWFYRTFILLVCICGSLNASSKKLEVLANGTQVHKNPDLRSHVIATLSQGEILLLASPRKFKNEWNYVYFSSQKNGALISGYVKTDQVTKLYEPTRSLTYQAKQTPNENKHQTGSSSSLIQWGMASSNLTQRMGDPGRVSSSDGSKIFSYRRQVLGRDCRIDYIFQRDHLVRTHYVFMDKYFEKSRYIEEYAQINQEFCQKYGDPYEENKFWHDPVLRDNPDHWGRAVSLGHLSYETQWHLNHTRILLSLVGSANQISLELRYSSLDSEVPR